MGSDLLPPSDRFQYVRDWSEDLSRLGWWHSFELPDGTRVDGVCKLEALQERLAQFPIPADLRGKRVLDVGAWDGWFSFEMEKRGAEVIAIDCWDNPKFRAMSRMLGSRVEYRQMDVYDLTTDMIGRFDIVLFLGVLYHLKHPLLALEKICAVTNGSAIVESFVSKTSRSAEIELAKPAAMEFYELDEFGGEFDNWNGPNLNCLMAFCRTAGFARVELLDILSHGASVACHRHWEPIEPLMPAPRLIAAHHSRNYGINFQGRSDEYVTCTFESAFDDLTRNEVQPEVAGFGTRAIYAGRSPAGVWQASFQLPPGLPAGWHDLRVRVRNSPPSNPVRIPVNVPAQTKGLYIIAVHDGTTWVRGELDLSQGNAISLWIEGLPENADRNNLRILLGPEKLTVTYVDPHGTSARQVNARISDESLSLIRLGSSAVTATIGPAESAPAPIRIRS